MYRHVGQNIIDLYDQFTHGVIGRREFLDRLAKMLGSSTAALAVLPLLQNDYNQQIVSRQDDRLSISQAEWDAEGTTMAGYLARLKGDERRPPSS